jgi:hypothetical protein
MQKGKNNLRKDYMRISRDYFMNTKVNVNNQTSIVIKLQSVSPYVTDGCHTFWMSHFLDVTLFGCHTFWILHYLDVTLSVFHTFRGQYGGEVPHQGPKRRKPPQEELEFRVCSAGNSSNIYHSLHFGSIY